jgi:cardiolipin synthase
MLKALTRRQYTTGLPDGPELRYFLRPGDLRPGCRVDILHGGGETYPAMLAAIAEARHYVHLETYLLRADRTGQRFRDALVERAEAGVAVRVIYDALGSHGLDAGYLKSLHDAGVGVVEYHPIAPWRQRSGLNRRDHQKILVIDDEVAFVGGTNIGDEYAPAPEGGGWHDMHARVEGPVVGDVARLFRRTWLRAGGGAITEPVLDPPPLEERFGGTALAHTIDNYNLRARGHMHRAYRHAINGAKRSVSIMNAYFIPGRRLRRAMKKAVARGVSVRVMVPAHSDVALAQFASRHLYARLLKWGVRIFEYEGRMMHAKCGVIDGIWSTIGSYNLDIRSMFHNLEVGLVVLEERCAATLERQFDEHLDRCREIHLTEWRRRPLWDVLLEWVSYRFRYWL